MKVLDAVLEDDMVETLPNERLGCFIQYEGQFLDVIMIKEGVHQIKSDTITVPLADVEGQPGEDPKTVIIVKDIQNDEPYAGSISIQRSIFLEGDLNVPHTQWVTLFDDQGDDEYDGAMGVNDDEEPRILFEFTVQEYEPPQQHLEEPQMEQEESPYKDQVEEE